MIERNVVFKDFRDKIRVALVYPNLYRAGMSCLGFHILYDMLNSLENVYCERFFLDFDKSLETNSELGDFDILLFSWQFELDALNILEILHRSGIPLRREEREKLLVVGGPCAVNPYPLKRFVDIFFIGEAEVNLIPFIELFARIKSKKETKNFIEIEGLYISESDNPTKRVYLKDLDSYYPVTQIMSPKTALGETFLLEVSRGCGRGCRFCLGGYIFRPRRERSLETLKAVVEQGIEVNEPKKISLLGASVSDYSEINGLLEFLVEKNLEISIPSLRADNLTATIIDALVKTRQKTLTIAPESNQRLRDVMNKDLSDAQIISATRLAYERGIEKVKMYFIIGNPTETLEDVHEVVELVKRLKKDTKGKIRLSITPLVPKPHTPFQWLPFDPISQLNKKLKIVQKELGKIRVEHENFKHAFLQATIALGDGQLGRIIEKAFYYGKGLGAFRRAFKEEGKRFDHYVKEKSIDKELPWDKIDTTIRKKFLIEEYEKSLRGESSGPCKDNCFKCGVC